MNDVLVSLFRSIFGFVSWAVIFGCIIVGGLAIVQDGTEQAIFGWILIIAGPLLAIIFSGTIALMIQNNDLLRQIAGQRGDEKQKPEHPEASPIRREPKVR